MGIELIAAAAVAGTAVSYMQGQKQLDAQKDAAKQAQANADKQAAQAQASADQAFNRANQKKPDTSALLAAASQSGKSGPSGTMLTGPTGIDPSALTLGKSNLLGL